MNGRLPTGFLVSALMKRVNDAGGFAAVRARGDADAGTVVAILGDGRLVERGYGPDGTAALVESRPKDGESVDDYWRRRRARDPDLWVIELDIADAERLVAETILGD